MRLAAAAVFVLLFAVAPLLAAPAGNLEPVTIIGDGRPNPSRVGQRVLFFINVSGTTTSPGGTMTFLDGATPLATVNPNVVGIDLSAAFQYSTSTLSSGTHTITARYNGDGIHAPGSFVFQQVVLANSIPAVGSGGLAMLATLVLALALVRRMGNVRAR